MAHLVRAIVSKKKLRLIPDLSSDSTDASGDRENEFDVTVTNGSDKFASFQLEITAPGLDPNSPVKWYTVEPEICAKKPPGESTNYHVVITKAPIPAYDTTIDLILKVFSVEFANIFTSEKLSLTIEKPRKSLRVYLPNRTPKVYPGDTVEIPVIVYNLSPKFTEVTLSCSGLEGYWMLKGTEQRLPVEPGDSERTSFWCQPPKGPQTLSQKYDFTIEAKSNASNYTTREQGTLEVLPQGVVEFSCTSKKQTIPTKRGKKFNSATYELNFENNSNLPQQVNIQISEQDQKQCALVIPEGINLNCGEIEQMYLVANKQRPLLGLKKILLFEVLPVLFNPDSGEPSTQIRPEPSSKTLELHVLPVIPPWLQLAGLALALLLLWLLWLLNPQGHHTGPVNSVRLIGNGGTVVSGSSDETIRRWQVDSSPWQVDIRRLKYEGIIADKTETKKAVRVIRPSPKDYDVMAAGLENGDIQLWDVSSKRLKETIFEQSDRVFDLDFTKDARYLFSGHGSGLVRQWDLNDRSKEPKDKINVGFTVSAVAVSESQNRPPVVAIAGRYNKLALWDLSNKQVYPVQYEWQNQGENQSKFQPVIGQQHYITSLATAGKILASADNKGYITLWNMDRSQCPINSSTFITNDKDIPGRRLGNIECKIEPVVLEQWRDGHDKQPVRSVALTQNGCYLASAGDDGRVMLWPLSQGRRLPQKGIVLAEYPGVRLNSVDIKTSGDYVLVTSDAEQYQVRLYRYERKNNGTNCQ